MKLAVFGASGKTGLQVVRQGLDQGHQVKALVRDPARMPVTHPQLEIVIGDALDAVPVAQTVEGTDAVIVVLGSRQDTSPTVLADGTARIISAMNQAGIRRLIVQSSYPMSGSPEGMKFLEGTPPNMLAQMRPAIDDKIAQEAAVRQSGLDWTIVRPLILTDGPLTGTYRAGENLDIKKTDTVSRADVAHFLLKSVSDPTWFGKTVTLAY